MGMTYMQERLNKDLELFDYIMYHLEEDDPDTWADWNHLLSSGNVCMRLAYVGAHGENPNFMPINHVPLQRSATRYIPSPLLHYEFMTSIP